jgi:flagellar biosynthesis chaperone FliJ
MANIMAMALLLSSLLVVPAASEQMQANPIRKVVTMLQKMQETVEAEGKKEEELFDKYMCYCKSGRSQLEAGIAAAETSISQLSSGIESGEGELAQLKEDLKSHGDDKAAAKTAMAEATTNREKEAAAFATESSEYTANIAATKKAVAAIEKGVGGAFLQTDAAQVVRQLVQKNTDLYENDRDEVMAFLSQSSEAPSDEILGIMKMMLDEMAKGLSEAEATEKSAIADFEGLIAAKTKEVEALTTAIEEKTQRVGQLSVDIVEMKFELSVTQESVV